VCLIKGPFGADRQSSCRRRGLLTMVDLGDWAETYGKKERQAGLETWMLHNQPSRWRDGGEDCRGQSWHHVQVYSEQLEKY